VGNLFVKIRGMFQESFFKNLHISIILLIIVVLSMIVIVREDFIDILDNNSVAPKCTTCSGH
jgi:hypothetical protein